MSNISLALFALCALFITRIVYADKVDTLHRERRVSSSAIRENGAENDDVSARTDRESVNAQSLDFPIVLPPYNYIELDQKDFGGCLLYVESISVQVFQNSDKKKAKPLSATAVLRGGKDQKNKFAFDKSFVSCYSKDAKKEEFSFRIKLNLNEKAEARSPDSKIVYFSVNDSLDLTIKFKIRKDFSWNLYDLVLNSPIKLNKEEKESWLPQDLTIAAGTPSVNSAIVRFGGFKDYCYACSGTPTIAWDFKEPYPITIGLSFNNLQIQAFDISPVKSEKEGKKTYRFTTYVNDCIGTFSVGSWMIIIVVLIFLFILSFAYLMLNSVQTMDRFDDPKQKQLIINAKE